MGKKTRMGRQNRGPWQSSEEEVMKSRLRTVAENGRKEKSERHFLEAK